MKILGICGSPKKKGSTTLFALEQTMAAVEGVDTEIIHLAEYNFAGCKDCGVCRDKLDCSIDDDFRNKLLPKLKDPEVKGILFATPVFFGGVSSQLKALFDRSVMFRRNGFRFENYIAGALAVGRSRNGGQELAALDIIKNSLIHGMIMVSDASPTSHFGALLWSGNPGTIEKDEEGLKTAVNLGKKMGEIVKRVHG